MASTPNQANLNHIFEWVLQQGNTTASLSMQLRSRQKRKALTCLGLVRICVGEGGGANYATTE